MVTLLLLRLLFAFAAVMMFATVVVLVTRPIYLRIHGWVARPVLAAVITTVLLGTVVAMPLAFLGVAFVQQALEFGQRGMAFVQDGGIATSIDAFSQQAGDSLPAAVADVLPDSTELTVLASDVLQTMTMGGLQQVTSQLPSIIASTGGLAIDAFVFLGAVGTLYVKGPALLKIVRDLVPLQEAYFDALFEVFGDLANRAVGGTVATALIQGLIATLGYAIAGVDGLVFFGSLTVLFAFVPLVGGAVIYLPLVVSTWIDHGTADPFAPDGSPPCSTARPSSRWASPFRSRRTASSTRTRCPMRPHRMICPDSVPRGEASTTPGSRSLPSGTSGWCRATN